MINYIAAIFFIFFNISMAYSEEFLLEGDWSNEVYLNNNEVPYSVFTINLKIDKQYNVFGELCYVSHEGRKIDCPINFLSQLINNEILFNFDSNFGGKNGKGLIQFSNCFLKWRLIKKPDGEFYFSNEAALFPDTIVSNSILNCTILRDSVVKNKSYLFDSPDQLSKTKMYLIKGDKIKLLQYSNNFYQTEYITNKNNTIRKWLHCSAIDACD